MARMRNRSSKENNPSAGMRKAVKKADKLSENQSEPRYTEGTTSVRSTHYGRDGVERNIPVVEAISDATGEIRTYPAKGKLRNFDKNIAKAESRGQAFIEASRAGRKFEGY